MTRISVCIPAYNRPEPLKQLLASVIDQDYNDFEIVITEDCSPKRDEIHSVVESAQKQFPARRIRYFENKQNLGYDGNLRQLVELADADYCLFMGDDDILCPGSLAKVGAVLERYSTLGAMNRAYRMVDRFTGEVTSESRYYPQDRYFPAGIESVVSFYRRFVVISGLVIHRDSARRIATAEFDGTLLYQLYLVGNILLERDGYFISDVLVLQRHGENHFFGSSDVEKSRFAPQTLTPQHSINFMQGMLRIAQSIQTTRGVPIYESILADLSSYSYPFLVIHSADRKVFWSYARGLSRLGFGRSPIYWAYVLGLLVLGPGALDRVQQLAKTQLRRTPSIGRFYKGIPVDKRSFQG